MEKKRIVVKTEPQEVEIDANIISNDELRNLWLNVRGGNADKDNVELMRHLATTVPDKEIQRALHYRAARLEEAIEQIIAMIYPKDEAEKVLVVDPEQAEAESQA